MAGARGLWRATGMKDSDFGKPIIAVVNSFTQFVPGHVHLKDLGQMVAREIEAAGGVAKEFNTIAVDDGIAMGHDGMLYSLPSRDLIADSVEYMVNAHCADAMICISNCDKITPGMLMAALARQHDVPAVPVLRLLETDRSDVLLVSDGYGETLADRDMTADLARKMWALVMGLHRAGLVHSEISLHAISVDRDCDIAFNDLRSAYISDSTTGRVLDKVNVLALTAKGLSVDESVSIAQESLSTDELRELIPYLQKAAINNASSAAKNVNAKCPFMDSSRVSISWRSSAALGTRIPRSFS